MEINVFHAMVEENGILLQDNVFVQLEIGTDFHVFNVLLVKLGTLQVFHVLAQLQLIGTVLTAKHVQVQADIGIINSMIVFVDQVTGMEAVALFVQLIQTGTEKLVLLVMEAEYGTHLT